MEQVNIAVFSEHFAQSASGKIPSLATLIGYFFRRPNILHGVLLPVAHQNTYRVSVSKVGSNEFRLGVDSQFLVKRMA